jgi:antirestriction protein ArdC
VTKGEIQAEAYERATTGQSMANYHAIIEGFAAMGIAPDDIKPRENVLTFNAWRALGRHVRKGEHGVRVLTYVEKVQGSDDETGDKSRRFRFPKATTVFHISQTDPD